MSDPTFEDLFNRMLGDETAKIKGAVPATVISYDAATQRCDAKPLAQMAKDGSGEMTPLAVCRSVPVRWPSGAGWALTGPMAPGDIVWLRPAGCDISAWSQHGTADATGTTPRKGSLSDVIAEPGSRPVTDPLASSAYHAAAAVLSAALVLLGDSTATEFVALATKTVTELNDIRTKFDAHIHGTPAGNSTVPTVLMGAAGSVAASKVKAK
jgi:hypothetical protein